MQVFRFKRHPLAVAVGMVAGLGGVGGHQVASAQDDISLEEVVVTAQRREESLLEAPVAVTTFDSMQLEELKANSLDQDIFDMFVTALDEAEEGRFDALVIGNEGKHFCAGANVFVIWMASQQGDFELVDGMVRGMQSVLMRVRYFHKPIVAAPFGMVLGGGAEVSMACSRRVAAAETFIGLVETGSVGLIPAPIGLPPVP